eukprot:6212978-Pleurochrysis_carterae.AAC.1
MRLVLSSYGFVLLGAAVLVVAVVETVIVRTLVHLIEASNGDRSRMLVSFDAKAGLSLSKRISSMTSGSAASSSIFMKRRKILTKR